MKKIFLLILLLISFSINAQEKFTEGIITQQQKMSSTNEQVNAQLAALGEMKTTTYIKGNNSRSELSNPMSGETISVIDGNKKEMLLMMDNPLMGKKYILKSIDPSEEDLKNIKVAKTDETKNILGYDCTKYNVTITKNGTETKIAMYTTNKIDVPSQQSAMYGDKIKGFPLLVEINAKQMGMDMKITMEVTDIKKESVPDDKFDMTVPEGYEKVDKMPGM